MVSKHTIVMLSYRTIAALVIITICGTLIAQNKRGSILQDGRVQFVGIYERPIEDGEKDYGQSNVYNWESMALDAESTKTDVDDNYRTEDPLETIEEEEEDVFPYGRNELLSLSKNHTKQNREETDKLLGTENETVVGDHTMIEVVDMPENSHLMAKEIIETTDVDVYIEPNITCSVPHTILLVVFSVTATKSKRELVRQTWGDTDVYKGMSHKFNLQLIFVLGEPTESTELENEARQNGDMLVFNFKEEYINLTKKGIYSFDWLNRRCDVERYVDYVFKTDDDVYVNLMRILPQLWYFILNDTKVHFVCRQLVRTKVLRDGKWSESERLWPYSRWPNYCQGIGYFISKLAFPLVVRGMHSHHLLTNEDVFFTAFSLMKYPSNPRSTTSEYVYKELPGGEIVYDYSLDYDVDVNRHALSSGTKFSSFERHILVHNFEPSDWLRLHRIAIKNKYTWDVFEP